MSRAFRFQNTYFRKCGFNSMRLRFEKYLLRNTRIVRYWGRAYRSARELIILCSKYGCVTKTSCTINVGVKAKTKCIE